MMSGQNCRDPAGYYNLPGELDGALYAQLARVQSQAGLGSWSMDCATRELHWSDETYRIFGIPNGATLDYGLFLSRVHPDDRTLVDEAWQATVTRGEPYDIEHRIVVDGAVLWVRERAEIETGSDGRPLWVLGTVQDIDRRKQWEEELLRSRQALRELAAHHEQVREEERTRIARELHDELGQYLTALRMDVTLLEIRYGQGDPELARKLAIMKQTINTTVNAVRTVMTSLRPAALDMGLIPAVDWLLEGFGQRTGIRCRLAAPQGGLAMDEVRATALFRIVQEALTNVARYARAGEVCVGIQKTGAGILLEIADDGVGFDPAEVRTRKAFGLMGIRERALMFGGEARVDSRPGAGTTLTIRIPHEQKACQDSECPVGEVDGEGDFQP